jgi:hypothetical protein
MVRKTREEKNQAIIDNFTDRLVDPYDDIFRCVYRPKKRGEGVMLDKDNLKSIESKLYELYRTPIPECQKLPWNKKFDCEKEKRLEMVDDDPSLWNDVMCLAVGENIKFSRSKSFFPAKVKWGEHSGFMSDMDKRYGFMLGSIFKDLDSKGNYVHRDEEEKPMSWVQKSYGDSPEKRVNINKEMNRLADRILM